MGTPREELRTGIESVRATTALLQRVRNAHLTQGLYEAAELEFWWSTPRSTDTFAQLFWFDDDDQPVAAAVVNDFGTQASLVYDEPTVVFSYMPDSSAGWIAHIADRALAHINAGGIPAVELEADRADHVMATILRDRGFEMKGDAVVEAWIDADARPARSELRDGYRLVSRSETPDRPHHMSHPDREQRLLQTSLYRRDLDLFVVDEDDNVAGYGLCWYDPATKIGVVEPMRTHDEHQNKGLARHILTSGVNLLVEAGAERVSIGWEPDNPTSGHLYESVGFVAHRHTEMWAGATG